MALGNFFRNVADKIRTSVHDFRTTVRTNPSSVTDDIQHDAVTNTGRFNIRDSLRNLGNTVSFGRITRAGKSNIQWSNQIVKAPTALTAFSVNAKNRYVFNVEIVGAGSGERSTIRLSLTREQAAQFVDRPEYYINEVTDYREKYKEPYFEVAAFYQ